MASVSDSLATYKQKRNFKATPEPAEGGLPGREALQFVIQKHWATRLHYDLRLELECTMKSWAVPKGPSYDTADKRMAVQVEDHPISYNRFEGQIPPGQYGSGRVIIWDKGFWVPVGDPVEGYRKGQIKFTLYGHKLQGRWTLVRMHGRDSDRKPAWLFIKEHDGHERPASEFDVGEEMPDSVKDLQPVKPPAAPRAAKAPAKTAAKSAAKSAKAPAPAEEAIVQDILAQPTAALPDKFSPQLATLVDAPPTDTSNWLFELKFDGYRLLARVDRGKAQLFTRNGHDWTAKMPQLAKAVAALPVKSGWLDGEILVMDDSGVPDFQALQNAFDSGMTGGASGASRSHIVYYLFDLPYCDGRDLRQLPLVERRELLRTAVAADTSGLLRFSEAFEARPQDLVASACKIGFEGVIGKVRDATYSSRRSGSWIKLKCSHRQEFVIGGYTDPQGSRSGLGSLLLGVHDAEGHLQYAGNVGSGFSQRTLAELTAQLEALASDKSPFANPRTIPKKAHWVEPKLLAEVSFAEWTDGNHVRQAVFRGLRDDKPAKNIVREQPKHLADAGRAAAPTTKTTRKTTSKARTMDPTATAALTKTSRQKAAPKAADGKPATSLPPGALRVTHGERVIDTSTGITKMELVRYYATVAPLMMEHLRGRPVALVRAPDGVGGELFFQKHLDKGNMPGVVQLDPALYAGHPQMLEVAQPAGLLSAAQFNVVEFHTWNARKDRIDRPDRMTFDLDPGEGVAWAQVQEAAELVRVLLGELELPSFLKTSGGKGLHVVVPIKRLHGWDVVKDFSQAVVQHLAGAIPQRFVAKSGPKNRVGKIFVDYLRNGWGATTAAAWTARSRPGLGISVPVAWAELPELTGGAHWTIRSVDQRLRLGNGPWQGYDKAAVSLAGSMKALGFVPEGA
jgi:bifunctional non-homologous end joining protein LigD